MLQNLTKNLSSFTIRIKKVVGYQQSVLTHKEKTLHENRNVSVAGCSGKVIAPQSIFKGNRAITFKWRLKTRTNVVIPSQDND